MAVLPLPTERTVALIITANGPSLARLNCFGFSGPTFAPFFAFAGFVAFAAFLLAFAFFSSFRDLTASGFWSTKMGVADLQYQGNVFVDEWTGCPDAALKKLGVG